MIWFCPSSINQIDKKRLNNPASFPSIFSPTSSLTSHLRNSIWFHLSLSPPAKIGAIAFYSKYFILIFHFFHPPFLSLFPPSIWPRAVRFPEQQLGRVCVTQISHSPCCVMMTHTHTRLRRGHSPAPQSLPPSRFFFLLLPALFMGC